MSTLAVLSIPFVIGLLLTRSDGNVGPIPVKVFGYILAGLFGLFLLLLLL